MFDNNQPFNRFRAELADRGVTIRWSWSTKRSPKSRYDDIAMGAFIGDGFTPAIGTAIFVDYGRDGFGLFIDTGTNSFTDDADRIAGRKN